MLQVKNTDTSCVATYEDLLDLLYHFSYWVIKTQSKSCSLEEVKREGKGGEVLAGLINCALSTEDDDFPFSTIFTDDEGSNTPELDESYLLLKLSEEDVAQVLYFYGFHDLEVSIEGDPTVTFVDGYELSDLTGGCHIKITGWLSWTKDYHEKQEEILRAAISQSIQDIANAKKGRVNHFAFL